MYRRLFVTVAVSLMLIGGLAGLAAKTTGQAGSSPDPWPAKVAMDRTMGDYEGTFTPTGGKAEKAYGRIIAEWNNNYRVVLYPWAYPLEDRKAPRIDIRGQLNDGLLTFAGQATDEQGAQVGPEWKGTVKRGKLMAAAQGNGGGEFKLKYLVRHSPTAGLKPPKGAVVLLAYDGHTPPSLEQWTSEKKKKPAWKPLPDGSVETIQDQLVSKQKFGDCQIHVEFCLPYMPNQFGQARANSGVFLANRYEMQVLDSFGLKSLDNDCAAVYTADAPLVNACFPPLSWQTYDIFFRTARFDKNYDTSELPLVTLYQNGVKVQNGTWILNPTSGWLPGNTRRGAIRLQYHLNPVHFRNVWVLERDIPYTPHTELVPFDPAACGPKYNFRMSQ